MVIGKKNIGECVTEFLPQTAQHEQLTLANGEACSHICLSASGKAGKMLWAKTTNIHGYSIRSSNSVHYWWVRPLHPQPGLEFFAYPRQW